MGAMGWMDRLWCNMWRRRTRKKQGMY